MVRESIRAVFCGAQEVVWSVSPVASLASPLSRVLDCDCVLACPRLRGETRQFACTPQCAHRVRWSIVRSSVDRRVVREARREGRGTDQRRRRLSRGACSLRLAAAALSSLHSPTMRISYRIEFAPPESDRQPAHRHTRTQHGRP